MNREHRKAFDFVIRNDISIEVVKVERGHPHPYEADRVIDFYSVEVSRGTESFIKKWTLGDLGLDDEDYTFPALVYGVFSRIPLYLYSSFEEYAMECGAKTKEVAKIWYENDLELHKNARRVFGNLFYKIQSIFDDETNDDCTWQYETNDD